jgi:hypothetical protein
MPFDSEYKNKQGKEIDLLVKIYTRPNLRGDEYYSYIGRNVIDNIFENLQVDEKTKEIQIYYPERWCNILEQRALLSRIPLLYPNIEKVTITTHSVYIIQCTERTQCGIYDDATQYPECEADSVDINVRYCPPRQRLDGIQVFKPI